MTEICTWKDCKEKAAVAKLNRFNQLWAHLCLFHDRKYEDSQKEVPKNTLKSVNYTLKALGQ